jgi:hypothetical protein
MIIVPRQFCLRGYEIGDSMGFDQDIAECAVDTAFPSRFEFDNHYHSKHML